MSYVTSAVIFVDYAPGEVRALLTEPQEFGREGVMVSFRRLNDYEAGGNKAMQSNVYAGAFNHIGHDQLVEWFNGLPWGKHGTAVLVFEAEGNSRTVVCTPAWEDPDVY
jgi:hypothetical protein